MKPALLPVLRRLAGWRLAAIVSACTVVAAVAIVSVMDLLLKGEVTWDYLLTGFVAAALVAPAALAILTRLLRELGRQQELALTNAVERVEARLRVALESADEGILMVDRDGRVLSTNERFLELWRVPKELAASGQDDRLLAHVLDQLADPEAFLEKVRRLYGGHEEASDTLHFRDGRVFARYTRALSVDDVDGRIWCFKDITEQARTQAALAEREELFRTIVAQANDAITLIDPQTLRFVEFNAAACAGLGYGREEFVRLTVPDIQAGMDADAVRRWLASLAGDGLRNHETLHRHKDGSLRPVLLSLKAVDLRGRTLLVGVWSDITERKRSEAAVAESRKLLQAVVDTAPVRVFWKDRDLRYLGCNPAFAADAGKSSPAEVVGRDDFQMAWSEQAEMYRADDRAVMETGIPKLAYEEPQTTPEGRHMWLRTSKVPLRNERGEVIGVLGIYEDATERKRAERHLALAVEATGVVLWELDMVSQRLAFDPGKLPVLGLTPDADLETLPGWLGRLHPEDRETFLARFDAAARPGDSLFDCEYRMVGPAGPQWIHTRGRVVQRGEGGRPELAVGTSMNITERKQIEAAIRASEEHSRDLAAMLRRMCDNVPDMIWAKDLEKRYVFANKAVCAQLLNAVDTGEPLGKTDMFFAGRERDSHPDDPDWHTFGELCQDSDAVTLARGVPSVFEEFGHVKGRMLHLDVHKAPFLNEKGQVIGTVGSARDITERKRIEAELDRHRRHLEGLVEERTAALLATEARASHILQSAADGLYGVDGDGRVTFINPAACRMLGYAPDQVIGRSAHELFHARRPDGSPYPADACPTRGAIRSGRQVRVDDEVYWRADGEAFPVMYAVHPMVQDGRNGAVISFVDMTAQRAATAAREKALQAAENLARVRSEFLANMSHEIRTPLNGVLGFAQIGHRNAGDAEKARNAFEKILASGSLLLGVVNEVLDFSKIEVGELRIDPIEMSFSAVADHAIDLVRERAGAKGLELRVELAADLPRTCVGDPLRIGQVLLNLLSNAVKFTDTGHVTLSACRDAGEMVVRVSDTGIGIGAAQLGHIFNPFQQADASTTRRFGGTGLGLAISKRIVELMGGSIGVRSEPAVGSTFEFRLPLVEPATPGVLRGDSRADPSLPPKPLSGLSILVAEDDEINQLVLEENLVEDGARVVMVGNGREAVERVERDGAQAYDVILMDIQMPEMDGYEATRRILDLAPTMPIIGQTAHAFREEKEKCLAIGMAGHLSKPIDPAGMVALILEQVRARRGV